MGARAKILNIAEEINIEVVCHECGQLIPFFDNGALADHIECKGFDGSIKIDFILQNIELL